MELKDCQKSPNHPLLKEILSSYTYDNWKQIAMRLSEVPKDSLREDVQMGFSHMYACVFNTLCEKCGDKILDDWFNLCVKAVLKDETIPVYSHNIFTCQNQCSDTESDD
jgi:hypothetical protein